MEVHFKTNILYQVLTCFLDVTIEILSIWLYCNKSEHEKFYFSYTFQQKINVNEDNTNLAEFELALEKYISRRLQTF